MSVIQRLWQRIRNPKGFVGQDLEGNRYFEVPNPNDASRQKRVVKYREGYDMWTYIAGERRLPVQWTSWLTHTRMHPPTLEELAADLERQKRVQLRVAMIEARDRNQMAQIAASTSTTAASDHIPTAHARGFVPMSVQIDQTAESGTQGHGASPIISKEPSALRTALPRADKPSTSDEPQAWTPRAVRRGG